MQVWKYVSGRKFFKLRITHHVHAELIARILCYKHREDDEGGVETLPDYSRAAIMRTVREQLAMNADAPNWWTDDIDEDWIDQVREWADDLVRRRFPDLE